MSEENGKPLPAPQPGQVALNVQVMPQGVLLNCQYPVQLGLPDQLMDDIAEQWIMQRPALLQKIAQKAVTAKKQELALIKHINSQRND